MNYYERYPGDYQRDTAHLSLCEHGAYTMLLDTYYSTERPLPAEYVALYRICRAMDKGEQAAVRAVADQFFPVADCDGLRHNRRADAVIADALPRINAARVNGKKGGRPRKAANPEESQQKPGGKPSGFSLGIPSETHGESSPAPTPCKPKNLSGGGTAEGSGCARDESPPAAALFEALVASDVDAEPNDSRVGAWAAAGVTPGMLATAIGEARQRRTKTRSQQPVNVGLLDAIIGDALAARAAPSAATGLSVGPWHTSWSGIVAKGSELGLAQGADEPDMDFRIRVYRAAGDGQWWDELDRRFRPPSFTPAGAILGAGR
ncbi:YdaU family protein [Burkholderia anthina]|uniref:YdaU family protein n=1 Tax=Burkholderia anthina TaxID=179879 RepID=UPI001588D433|nr:YdaU family protein [Burkholderia anthina]